MVILTVATDERAAWNGVMAPLPDRTLHLHRGRDGRPRVGRIVQSRPFTRPGALQPGLERRLDLHRRPAGRRRARRSDLGVPHAPTPGSGSRSSRPLAEASSPSDRSRRSAGSPSRTTSGRPSPSRSGRKHGRARRPRRPSLDGGAFGSRTDGSRRAHVRPPETYGFSIGLTSIARAVRVIRPAASSRRRSDS